MDGLVPLVYEGGVSWFVWVSEFLGFWVSGFLGLGMDFGRSGFNNELYEQEQAPLFLALGSLLLLLFLLIGIVNADAAGDTNKSIVPTYR
jgi:hypothetical protein